MRVQKRPQDGAEPQKMTHSHTYTAHHVHSGLPPREGPYYGSVEVVDPATVEVNRWHGRASLGLASAHFESLKRDIAGTGGNVVPVLGCPRPIGSSFELVYGSLRVHACRELGLPVVIVVRHLLEQEVFATMVREGAGGWSLFELGTSIVRALDGGLFASSRKLAVACGLSHQVASTAMRAARLPKFVVQAFGSPNKLTSAAVSKLAEALEADPEGVERRAKALLGAPTTASKSVLTALLGDSARQD